MNAAKGRASAIRAAFQGEKMNDHPKGGSCPAEACEEAQPSPQVSCGQTPLNDPTRQDGSVADDGALGNVSAAEAGAPDKQPPSAEKAELKEAPGQHKVRNAITIAVTVILIVLLFPLLCINLTLIIKGSLNPDMPPDIFGTAPLAVTTDAMAGDAEGCFDEGALIFVKLLNADEKETLKEGDVITFRSEELFVTYRITEVVRGEDGSVHSFRAIGDQDAKEGVNVPLTVSPENVIGVVTGSVAGLGGFAMFLQTPVGVLVFVGIPVVAYLIYDISRIALSNKRAKAAQGEKLREKDEEIARLKAMVGEAPDAAEEPEEE